MPATPRRLFDPNTVEILHAELSPGRLVVLSVCTLILGALVVPLHVEYPFLSYWLGTCSTEDYAYECTTRTTHGVIAGIVIAVVVGASVLAAHRHRRLAPTITCRRCGTSGWVLDIEPSRGRCPRCGADRYDYRIWFAGGTGLGPRFERVREYDIPGADLVRRFQETRKSALRRYY